MMIRTAGGPSVSPIDFNERKTPLLTRKTWVALGVVGAAHVALGGALYYQRFELGAAAATPERPPTVVEIWNKPKEPAPPIRQTESKPQPPTTKTNPLPEQPLMTETIEIVTGDKVAENATLTTTHTVADPQPEATSTTPQPPQPPAVIRSPSWISQPSGAQLMRAYPDRAIAANVRGSASLNCLVQTSGRVTDCNIVGETPGGYGFGRAAQSLSRYFQINPRTVNGAAEGSRVNVNLRFNLPE